MYLLEGKGPGRAFGGYLGEHVTKFVFVLGFRGL